MACIGARGRPAAIRVRDDGRDSQPQVNVQVLHRLLAGEPPAEAVAAPRVLHGRFASRTIPTRSTSRPTTARRGPDVLAERHPRVAVVPARSERLGHAHAIAIGADGEVSRGGPAQRRQRRRSSRAERRAPRTAGPVPAPSVPPRAGSTLGGVTTDPSVLPDPAAARPARRGTLGTVPPLERRK